MTTQPPIDGPIDFAILTAIEVDRRALCVAFGLTDDAQTANRTGGGKLLVPDEESYEIVGRLARAMGQIKALGRCVHHNRTAILLRFIN
ncbi:hypothetical protein ACMHYB_61290 [Sorangium sp. So ce1128]